MQSVVHQAAHPYPVPPRSFLDSAFLLSTHLVPAALPRSTPDISPPRVPPTSADKGKADAAALEEANAIVAMRYKQWDGKLNRPGSIKPLWVCLNRYLRREAMTSDTSRGVTLLLLPANGFPKEVHEPRTSPAVANTVQIIELGARHLAHVGSAEANGVALARGRNLGLGSCGSWRCCCN